MNQLQFNKRIKNYIKNRGLSISDDVSPKEIYKQIDELKNKVFKKDFMKKDIELRNKSNGNTNLELSDEQIKSIEKEDNFKNIVLSSQNKMFDLYCNYVKD